MKYCCAHYLIVAWLVVGSSTASNVASVNEEGVKWSSVGPSDCCDPPPNLPPDALQGQKGYHVDSVVMVAPDVDVEAFLAGIENSYVSPIASTAAPHGIVSTTIIDPFDTTMGGGGFHPVEMNVTNQQGFYPSAFASSSILFPDTGLDESEIKPTPIDEQLVAYEEGTLLEEIQAETGMVKTAESEMASELDGDDDSRRLMGHLDRSEHHKIDRKLQVSQGINTAPIGYFNPLACNANIDTVDCSTNKLSTLVSGTTTVVTIPCGMCYTYDLSVTPTTIGGLNIIGKLYVPPNHKSTLMTKFVFVQGVLVMSDTSPISKNNTSMRIVLTGDSDVTFTPATGNANVAGGTFNAGVKPFLVAGGRLEIRGWTGSLVEGGAVETWTPLLEMAEGQRPNPTLSSIAGKESTPLEPPMMIGAVPSQQCPRKLVDHNFDDTVDYRVWSGGEGMILHHTHDQGKAIVLDDLGRVEQGFRLDYSDIIKECPIIANATYLVTMRLKVEVNGTAPGTKSVCQLTGTSCPRIYRKILRSTGGDRYAEQHMQYGNMGRFSEWFWFSTLWTWTGDDLTNVLGGLFIIDRFPIGAKVSLDEFIFELPSTKSFAPTSTICSELAINGNAEDNDGNGYSHYPFISNQHSNPLIYEETVAGKVNRFYRIRRRDPSSASWNVYVPLQFRPNTACFVKGHEYTVSLRTRLFSYNPTEKMKLYIRLIGRRPTSDTSHLTVLRCPEMTQSNDWTTCSAPLLVTEELASLTDVKWETMTEMENVTNRALIDFDDISIKWKSGVSEGLVVSTSAVSRWASNSEILITSSTLNWRDSQDAVINSIEAQAEGKSVLKLNSGIVPVLSEKETPGFGVEVAMLTRNIKIEGETLVDQCGTDRVKQTDYRGNIATTDSKFSCQKWTAQFPKTHSKTPQNYPNAGLGDHNFCRNPDGQEKAWCYSTNPNKQWEFCNVPTCKGGYLQVLHTNVTQVIEGLELTNMGQQGFRNRFPIQFLYTRDVKGTSISRNAIRNSNHRCIVMDGASNATIAANVAHDTAGHCYFFGYEANHNTIISNLGSKTNDVIGYNEQLAGQSDHDRATFLIRSSENDFIGNVASGGAGRGFIAQLHWMFVGEDDCSNCNGIDPSKRSMRAKPMGIFRNNKAHSNSWQGFFLENFEQFYTVNNANVPVFENTMAYRNREHGIYTYNNVAAEYRGGKMTDNQWGISLISSDRIKLQDFDIVGSSQVFKDHTATRDTAYQLCPSTTWRHEGIIMMAQIWRTQPADPNLGLRLRNVSISGFDKEKEWYPSCKSTEPITIIPDGWANSNKHFDYISSVGSVKISDSRGVILNGCEIAATAGVKDLVITDMDGSFDPSKNGTSGSLVHDYDHVTGILGVGACTSIGKCLAFCPNACLRTFTLKVEQFGTENWKLRIKRALPETTMDVPTIIYTHSEAYFSDSSAGRKFSASLPAGTYTAEFINENGYQVWPQYMEETWQKPPDCAGFAQVDSVTLLKPPISEEQCVELVRNGGIHGNTTFPWISTLGQPRNIVIRKGMGIDGTDAIGTMNREYHWTGLGQDIDSRCLELMRGKFYEFSAYMKITAKNDPTTTIQTIDPNKEYNSNLSPVVTLNMRSYQNISTKEFMTSWEDSDKAFLARPYNYSSFNLVHGIFRLPPNSVRAFFEIERSPDNQDFIVDNVSLKRMVCDPNKLILNGDLTEPNTKYWDTWGGTVGLGLVTGYGGTGQALKAFTRPHLSHGPAQIINTDCVPNVGDRLAFTGKIRFEKSSAPGVASPCNPFTWSDSSIRCSDIWMFTKKNGVHEYNRVAMISTNDFDADNGWYSIHGLWSLRPYQALADFTKVYLDGISTAYDVIIDNMQIKHLPLQCDTLVENPSFINGSASFWHATERDRLKLKIYSPGAGGDFALRAYDRDHSSRGMRQQLDKRCFVTGEEYAISAKFRLLNSTSGVGLTCNTNDRTMTGKNCPSVMIYGEECVVGSSRTIYWRLWNTRLGWQKDSYNDFSTGFQVNDALASCLNVFVYLNEVSMGQDIVVDDLQISKIQATTTPPTLSPTKATEPENEVSDTPTHSPTSMPTVSTVTSCPNKLFTPVEIPSGPVMLARSSLLCILTKAISDPNGTLSGIAPVALSYDGGVWEKAAGEFAFKLLNGQEIGDYSTGSQLTLPNLNDTSKYYLTSYSHTISEADKVARLLETATFGTTAQDIASVGTLTAASAKQWIIKQMNTNLTSHREYFRKRTNPRLTNPVGIARSGHPCDPASRWRRFAFSKKEGENGVISVPRFTANYNNLTDTFVTIMMNGFVRTVVKPMAFVGSKLEFNKEYLMCGRPEEYAGGWIALRMGDNSCQNMLPNPIIAFYNSSAQPHIVLSLPNLNSGSFEPFDDVISRGGEFILRGGLVDPVCSQINDVAEESDEPIFGRLPDGSWLLYDPRMVLEDNSPTSPINDGGGLVRSLTALKTKCSNAPRTFLNEEHCFLSNSSMACGAASTPSVHIELNAANIITLNDITGQYVYGIVGLPLRDVNNMTQPSPCVPNLRSRWEILDASKCTVTCMGAETNSTLVKLLSQRGTIDMNQGLRDITFPSTGMSCSSDHTSLVEVDIIINTKCFRRVHPEHLSVYDFTYWAEEDTHPGNMVAAMRNAPHPIKKWMDLNRSAILLYPAQRIPGNAFLNAHPINRWNMYSPKFTKVGRFGDTVKFVDLPNEIRQATVAEYFGAKTEVIGGAILTCGSPYETANDPNNGHLFEVTTERDTEWDLWRQREYIWTQISLTAPDQLRQRVAWALAQLLVVARFAIEVEGSHTEAFLTYYDIFVRHAFGNYRDVLREISHSPLMAENLSYLQSKSAAYMWENQNIISFADENFAREIMQLFSTGLNKLNIDGTPVLDNDGQPIQAYTNEEIMSFARIWTGFDYQQGRGNVEENTWSGNRHDPMKIQAGWRDKFPKTDMTGGYIGDGYPLCTDLPAKMFLKKGAQYRLLGFSHMPELMDDDPKFITDLSLKKFALAANSTLKSKLCNADPNGNCQWKNTVTLEQNLDCTGQECAVDTVRVVQVSGAIHYEYVRPACVEQAFYTNAKKVIYRHRNSASSCANPTLPYASEACCTGNFDSTAERAAYLYDQERVTYSTADARCKAINMGLCDFTDVTPLDWSQEHKKGFYWTSKSCAIQVKVDATGQVALVYEPEFYAFLHPHVRSDNRNFFKVYWEGDYPKNSNEVSSGNNCGNNVCVSLESGGCLCGTTMSESRVFARMPKSVNEVLSTLTVGAYDPAAYPPGKYTAPVTVNGVKAYVTANGSFDTNTVFEVSDEYGRLHRFKNVLSKVSIVGASTYVFRNAPSFMSVLNTEATTRDAQHETEAALDHYFYHDNTAPFIAFRLIQRLTTSNPKPRYVKSVATAFRTGNYEGIGKGKYGDLAATIAAVLLDREARSVILDADPFKGSLREPLIRLTALMRGMEIQLGEGQRIVKLFDLDYKIGMMAHGFRSVFSFFLPEYVPSGKPRAATLVAPETMLMDMPKTVGLLNGMFSLVKYGLSRCYGGFGDFWTSCNEGTTSLAAARLSFSRPYNRNTTTPQAHAENVVGELATILTSGRLSAANKAVIKDEYIKKLNQTGISDPAGAALRMAQQLVLASPEFHTTNIATRTGAARPLPPARPTSGAPYKAIVYVLFSGGCDSYNMLVPHTCSVVNDNMTLWDEYVDVRQNVALSRDSLNVLNGTGSSQACETFGVHPRLGSLAKLYNEGDLLFHANTGELSKETNKENYWRDTITELFAHNFQQQAAQKLDPLKAHDGTGVLGRIRDILTKKKGRNVGAFSINANSISIIGKPGIAETPTILSENGVTAFNSLPSSTDMDSKIALLNGETNAESGVFADWFSTTLLESLTKNKVMFDTLSNKATTMTFPTSGLGRQLSMVAKMIDSRAVRGTDADMFFVETGGWDTHDQLLMNQERLFADVDASLMAFADEMKAKNTWNSVTLIETSDFARTNSPNGNAGSDHAWGGNYIMMGGGVKGGQLVGTYPSLREGALLNIGRGRMIPTKSWESVFLPIAKWAGVDEADFDFICPNRKSFPASHFTPASSLFELS